MKNVAVLLFLSIVQLTNPRIEISLNTLEKFERINIQKDEVYKLVKDSFPSLSNAKFQKYFKLNVPGISDSRHIFIQRIASDSGYFSNSVCYFIIDSLDGNELSNYKWVCYYTNSNENVIFNLYSYFQLDLIEIICDQSRYCNNSKDTTFFRNNLLFEEIVY